MTNKVMVLLAGYPGTGKSYLAKEIQKRFGPFDEIVQDTLKETLWDEHGFSSLEEKVALENKAWEMFYQLVEMSMQQEHPILLDYPFSDKQKAKLMHLQNTYGYRVMTLRLTANLPLVFQRRIQRDLDPTRHLGHMVTRYHKGDVLEDRNQADAFITFAAFQKKCTESGYASFVLGDLIELEMSDFNTVDYEKVYKQIETFIKEEEKRG